MEQVSVDGGPSHLDEETVFDLLGNARRRKCLKRLAPIEDKVPVQELAGVIAQDIAEQSSDTTDIENSVYVSLCQNHLPKLDAADIVDYDPEMKTVEPSSNFPAVENRLNWEPNEPEGSEYRIYYAAASLLTVVLLAAAVVRLPLAVSLGVPVVMLFHLILVGSLWLTSSRTTVEV